MTAVEAAFGVPVIESLRHDRGGAPDGVKPAAAGAPHYAGSVGIAAGPEIAIMDTDDGHAAADRAGWARW